MTPANSDRDRPVTTNAGNPKFRRVLTLQDLIFYGIVLIQPIACVGIYGLVTRMSAGHAVTAILLAMFAMTLTAVSYGRMATVYPTSGSAYTYVSEGLNAHFGFIAGWVMLLDYFIIPIVNVIYVSLTMHRVFAVIPNEVWAAMVAIGITLLNLRGIGYTKNTNNILMTIMSLVIAVFFILGIRYLLRAAGIPGLFNLEPLYNPDTFRWNTLLTATSLAALTYIGFDGVTTLAEETVNPKRTVPLATVIVCVVTGILSGAESYLAQRVWPDYMSFPNLDTAFLDVTRRIGGAALFEAMAAVLVLSCFGTAFTGQASAARLMYSMGREGVLPQALGRLNPRTTIPALNTLLIGISAFTGSLFLSYERAAELLNFGAFLAFIGVNLAAALHSLKDPERHWTHAIVPILGLICCIAIWISLPTPALIIGGIWLIVGIIYLAIQTRGFQRTPRLVQADELR
jgi:putrescine importer